MSLKHYFKKPVHAGLLALCRLRNASECAQALDLRRINRIMILQLGGIGDVLLIFPLLRALKQTFPDKTLLTVTEHGDWLFNLAPDLNEGATHIRFDMSAGYLGKLKQIQKLRREHFDLVISTARGDGIVETSAISWLTGTPLRIGFAQEGNRLFYTHTREFSYDTPLAAQNLGLLKLLDCSIPDCRLGLELNAEQIAVGQHIIERHSKHTGPVITLHPFAGNFAELKAWPTAHYVQLAEMLVTEFAANLFILGSSQDRPLWDAACPSELVQKLTNLCGEISFFETAAIIKHADLFIGNDSSLLHLAESFQIPAIGIFGSTSPSQILPRGHSTEVIRHNVNCGPCYLHQPQHSHRCHVDVACLKKIDVESVFDMAAVKLDKAKGGGSCASP